MSRRLFLTLQKTPASSQGLLQSLTFVSRLAKPETGDPLGSRHLGPTRGSPPPARVILLETPSLSSLFGLPEIPCASIWRFPVVIFPYTRWLLPLIYTRTLVINKVQFDIVFLARFFTVINKVQIFLENFWGTNCVFVKISAQNTILRPQSFSSSQPKMWWGKPPEIFQFLRVSSWTLPQPCLSAHRRPKFITLPDPPK